MCEIGAGCPRSTCKLYNESIKKAILSSIVRIIILLYGSAVRSWHYPMSEEWRVDDLEGCIPDGCGDGCAGGCFEGCFGAAIDAAGDLAEGCFSVVRLPSLNKRRSRGKSSKRPKPGRVWLRLKLLNQTEGAEDAVKQLMTYGRTDLCVLKITDYASWRWPLSRWRTRVVLAVCYGGDAALLRGRALDIQCNHPAAKRPKNIAM